MNILDIRTLFINQTLTYVICMVVVGLLWQQNRRRFQGLDFWLACFVMQALSIVLIILRDNMPAWVSIVMGGNALPLGGTILMYVGLERFVGQRSRQFHNILLLTISMAIHAYFAIMEPNLAVRNINFSCAALLVYLQIAWLLLRRVDSRTRSMTRTVGWVFVAFAVVSVARIFVNLTDPAGNDLLKANNTFDVLLIFAYQVLFFAVAFGLFLMINQRLFAELHEQQTALQKSETRYRQLVELSPNALFVTYGGRLELINSATLSLMRASHPEQLLGKSILDIVHPDYHSIVRNRLENVLTLQQKAPLIEEKFVRLDGTVIDVEVTTAPFEYQGQPAVQSIVRDISERKRAEAVLQLRLKLLEYATGHSLEELMRRSLDEIGELTNSPIGFYHFVEADQKTLSLQAWSTRTIQEFCQAEGAGMHYDIDKAGVWVECVHKRAPVIHNSYSELPHRKGLPAGHTEVQRELVVPTMSAGEIVSILGVGNKPSNYDEDDVVLVSYVADVIWGIVERKRTEMQLQMYQTQLEAQNLELRKLWLAIEQSGNTIVITDAQGAIQYANPAFEQSSGYTVHEAIGTNPRILKSGTQSEDFYKELWHTITNGEIWRGEFHNRRKDGTLYWEAAAIAPVQDDSGQVINYIAIKADITERKKMEAELERLATIDSLTGILNRRQFTELAQHELERARHYMHPISILMLDIDYFKGINDTYGHPAGDAVLASLGQLLSRIVRARDLVGRYGGEEFMILLPEISLEKARIIADRIHCAIMDTPVIVDGQTIRFTASIGLVSNEIGNEKDFETLLRRVDQLLYQAKQSGRNQVVASLEN